MRGYVQKLSKHFIKLKIDSLLNSFKKKGAEVSLSRWLHFAEAARAALAPAAMSVQLCKTAVTDAENQMDVMRQCGPALLAKGESVLKDKRASLRKAESELEDTQKRLVAVRLLVGEQVGQKLVSDEHKYDAALQKLAQSESTQYAALMRVAKCLGNRGSLKSKHVQVEVDGKLVRGRVEASTISEP